MGVADGPNGSWFRPTERQLYYNYHYPARIANLQKPALRRGGWATWQHAVTCGQVADIAADIGKRWTLSAAMKMRGLRARHR